jgi:hypothetical protein
LFIFDVNYIIMNKIETSEYNKLWRQNHPEYHKNYKKGIKLNNGSNKLSRDKNRLLKYRKINKKTECWEWTGKTHKKGYGVIQVAIKDSIPKKMLVHRFAIEIFTDNILNKDDVINHLCHNRKCFNPEHLQITSQRINMSKKNDDWKLFYKDYKDLVDRFNSIDSELKTTYRNWHIKMQLEIF